MSLSDLASLGSFISALAVAGSLIYLGLQTHQAAKHTRALIQQGRAARITDTGLRLADFAHLDGYLDFLAGEPIKDPVAFMRFSQVFFSGLLNAEDTYFQYREGLLNQEAFDTFRGAFGITARWKGWRTMWTLRRSTFGSGFRGFVDGVVADAEAYTGPTLQDRWNALATEAVNAVT